MTVPRRVATLSVHTSPLDQPGTGDAGGMNVYVVELSKQLALRGVEVEIFTRATTRDLAPVVELAPGVLVRHITAGPLEGLPKNDLPAQLCAFTSGAARARLGLAQDAVVLLFVGRIQPLKAPDVLLRAAGMLLERDPSLRERLVVAVVGGPSGSGLEHPEHLQKLAGELGITEVVRFAPPAPQRELADWYRAATLCAVPSYNESFGLVAVEAQACGTPVVAAAVGGLPTAVRDGVSGVLVDGHDPAVWARAISDLVGDPLRLRALSVGAVAHARQFGWGATAEGMLDAYASALADRRPHLVAVR